MNIIKGLIEYEHNNTDIKQLTRPANANPNINNLHTAVLDGEQPKKPTPKSTKVLGAGIDAIVFHNTRKPQSVGVVTKWIRNQQTNYEDNACIRYLIEGNKLGNPFIPVVYDIKQVETEDNFLYDFYIKMEKLGSTLRNMELDSNQIMALLNQIVVSYEGDPITKEVLEELIEDSTQNNNVKIGSNTYNINETYSQAITLIQSIISSSGGGVESDMHANNIMIRITSVGMQLVITDPISEN